MRPRLLVTALLAPLVLACTETAGPSIGTVAGIYGATTFTSTTNGQTTDHLADNAQIVIALSTDGTTDGQLLIPGGNEDGTDLSKSSSAAGR